MTFLSYLGSGLLLHLPLLRHPSLPFPCLAFFLYYLDLIMLTSFEQTFGYITHRAETQIMGLAVGIPPPYT
jgi:hypothetical protein